DKSGDGQRGGDGEGVEDVVCLSPGKRRQTDRHKRGDGQADDEARTFRAHPVGSGSGSRTVFLRLTWRNSAEKGQSEGCKEAFGRETKIRTRREEPRRLPAGLFSPRIGERLVMKAPVYARARNQGIELLKRLFFILPKR